MPRKAQSTCLNGNLATAMNAECIEFLHGLDIDDYFVVFTKPSDPSGDVIHRQAAERGMVLIDEITQGKGDMERLAVLHYRYQPSAVDALPGAGSSP